VFDVGFWELVLVGVVALLVVGPERLPEVARTAGRWVGAARRMVATFRADIEREIRAEQLKEVLQKQTEFKGAYEVLEETRKDLEGAVAQLNTPVDIPAADTAPRAPPAAPAEPTASPGTPAARAAGSQPGTAATTPARAASPPPPDGPQAHSG